MALDETAARGIVAGGILGAAIGASGGAVLVGAFLGLMLAESAKIKRP